MLETFTAVTFQEVQGTTFHVRPEGWEPLPVELVEVHGFGLQGTTGREQFSLLFRGPTEPLLPQALYPMEHEKLGSFQLFLVPVGPDAQDRHRYEAVFT